jgi:hypothetical protein
VLDGEVMATICLCSAEEFLAAAAAAHELVFDDDSPQSERNLADLAHGGRFAIAVWAADTHRSHLLISS